MDIERRAFPTLLASPENTSDGPAVRTLFLDEYDARGTRFVPLPFPAPFSTLIESLVPQLESWREQGMPIEEMLWQAEPTQVVAFERPEDGFFPRGFLAEIVLRADGKTQLFLWKERIFPSSDVDEQVIKWTRACYKAIIHYYRVLLPAQEHWRKHQITILHIR